MKQHSAFPRKTLLEKQQQQQQRPTSGPGLETMACQTHAEEKSPFSEKARSAIGSAKLGSIAATPALAAGMAYDSLASKDTGAAPAVLNSVQIVVGGLAMLAAPAAVPTGTVWSTGSLAAAAYYGVRSLFYKDPANSRQIADMVSSLGLRCTHVCTLLVQLELETAESLRKRFADKSGSRRGAIYALATFSTALASRAHDKPALCLANGLLLHRRDCPAIGHGIFDLCLWIRDMLRDKYGFHRLSNAEIVPQVIRCIRSAIHALDRGTVVRDETPDPDLLSALCGAAAASRRFSFLDRVVIGWDAVRSATPYEPVIARAIERGASARSGTAILLVDGYTGKKLTDACMTDTGVFCNADTAAKLKQAGRIKDAIRVLTHGGPCRLVFTQDFFIDPIVPDRMAVPVLADDGHFYDIETVKRLMKEGAPGMGGVAISKFYQCREGIQV